MDFVVIGLTGQTGAGKSTVRDCLAGQGIELVDADAVAHDIADRDLDCLVEVVERFSCIVLNDSGKLDRRRLGRIVFADKKQLTALNKIMFPYISKAIAAKLEKAKKSGAAYVLIDAAALFESGCDKLCDTVISVVADEQTRLKRIIERDGLSKRDAADRVAAQHAEEYYTARSNYIIENNTEMTDLGHEAKRIFARIAAGDMGAPPRDAESAAESFGGEEPA